MNKFEKQRNSVRVFCFCKKSNEKLVVGNGAFGEHQRHSKKVLD
ncbi:hypothetical protein LYSIN_02115 [Lysinibacillus sphaericus]|uniref:Uncharacterized protein n=1 Tax=Lysinibacillus sphaericus TaxID=1421 RepID=A0A2S5D2R3_LYSSH|nr:hypothetical protein LYSIN_02115 [Lysinibacillus sphaericus]